ncbi:hypothetical protein [Rathayibacter rathayi]|uniref:hypothetical protein n=1 Tax=Rathayibacter rathayi TaxID=33887 RepID=UPI001CA58257|nr:hypothetical protein [Rathayibacter rathayi]
MRIAQLTYSTACAAAWCAGSPARRRSPARATTSPSGHSPGGDASVFRPVDPAVTVRVVPFPHREGEVRAAMEALAAAYS